MKIEISKEFLRNIIEYQEIQRTRINEIIKTFSGKDFNSHKFILLCEHMVLLSRFF